MDPIGNGKWKRQIALLLILLAAAGMVYYYVAVLIPRTRATDTHPTIGRYSFGNDFYQVWLTSRECVAQRLDPYSLAITREIQTGIFGHILNSGSTDHPPDDYRAFAYPAFVDIFGLPVAWLPFSTAKIVLAIVLPFLIAASVSLWSRGLCWNMHWSLLFIFIALTLSSYHGLEALYALQPGLIVGVLLAGAVASVVVNKLRLAGCLLAFSTIKPQVSILLILYLLLWAVASWRKYWEFALSFLITLAVLSLSAMLVWPTWIISWQKVMMKYPGYYSRPPLLSDVFGPYLGGALLILALAGTIKFAWDSRRVAATSFRFGLTISFLLAITTVTMLPEHAIYDHLILLPATMMVVRYWRTLWERDFISRWTFVLAAGALFWPWIAAPMVILVRFIAPHLTSAVLFLPVRTAAAIPFVALGLLFLTFWQIKENEPSFVPEVSSVQST